jgi:hypothetical protein
MPRPRKYPDAAARQAAFRARSEIVDRAGLEELRALLERLQVATRAAAAAGDATARAVNGATAEGTLRQRLALVAAPSENASPSSLVADSGAPVGEAVQKPAQDGKRPWWQFWKG